MFPSHNHEDRRRVLKKSGKGKHAEQLEKDRNDNLLCAKTGVHLPNNACEFCACNEQKESWEVLSS
jgi:hypothetical protein